MPQYSLAGILTHLWAQALETYPLLLPILFAETSAGAIQTASGKSVATCGTHTARPTTKAVTSGKQLTSDFSLLILNMKSLEVPREQLQRKVALLIVTTAQNAGYTDGKWVRRIQSKRAHEGA